MAPAGAEAAAWGSTRPLWMRLSASGHASVRCCGATVTRAGAMQGGRGRRARVQASIEGFEPAFSTCSDARSSTTCCRRSAARRSALIDGRRTARAQESTHAGRGEGFHQA